MPNETKSKPAVLGSLKRNWALIAMVAVTAVFCLILHYIIQQVIQLRDRVGPEYLVQGAIGSSAVVGWVWVAWVKATLWLSKFHLRQAARLRMNAAAAAVRSPDE